MKTVLCVVIGVLICAAVSEARPKKKVVERAVKLGFLQPKPCGFACKVQIARKKAAAQLAMQQALSRISGMQKAAGSWMNDQIDAATTVVLDLIFGIQMIYDRIELFTDQTMDFLKDSCYKNHLPLPAWFNSGFATWANLINGQGLERMCHRLGLPHSSSDPSSDASGDASGAAP